MPTYEESRLETKETATDFDSLIYLDLDDTNTAQPVEREKSSPTTSYGLQKTSRALTF